MLMSDKCKCSYTLHCMCILTAEYRYSCVKCLRCKVVGKNGLSVDEREHFLSSMQTIANAQYKQTNEIAVTAFRRSRLYNNNKKVETYAENWWLNIPEVS